MKKKRIIRFPLLQLNSLGWKEEFLSERGKFSPFWLIPHQGPIQEYHSLVLTKTYSQEPQPRSTRDKPLIKWKHFHRWWEAFSDLNIKSFFNLPQCSHWGCCRELSYWSRQNIVLFHQRQKWVKIIKHFLFSTDNVTYQLFQQWKCLTQHQSCPSTLRWCGQWSNGRRWSTCGRSPRSACTLIPEWILCMHVLSKSIKHVDQTSTNNVFEERGSNT